MKFHAFLWRHGEYNTLHAGVWASRAAGVEALFAELISAGVLRLSGQPYEAVDFSQTATPTQLTPISVTVKKLRPELAAEEIDAKSQELIHEFMEHLRRFQEEYPGDHDPRKIFESWAIQKIAALQYTALQLTAELVDLRKQIRTK
jgi:hypothetical protein